jgi:glycosyltransferase involved in cell wall biosynthesis
MSPQTKPRLLVFIVAYNAEKTIRKVVQRIPASLRDSYDADVLIIDDSSKDSTFEQSHSVSQDQAIPFRVTAMFNPVNQGYGGNQKIGYRYALENHYDFVALIHGDGQYAPELLPELLEPLRAGQASAVFGSRMMTPNGALEGGMPLYKFVGNKTLTWIQNKLLGSNMSEFHSGYRLYSVNALAGIPFQRNSNDFHFDTEIIVQLMIAGLKIKELPIPTFYGDEVCHVNGWKYGLNVLVAALKARLQSAGLFYDRKFDCSPPDTSPYQPKLTYDSPHAYAFDRVREGSRVLDIGCAAGYLGTYLTEQKQCRVDGIDSFSDQVRGIENFYKHDLNAGLPKLDYSQYDYILMLDVIEHLASPEAFLDEMRIMLSSNPKAEFLISTANVAYFIPRLMMLLGQFNYGKRGILDLTHTRLFTFASFTRAIEQSGYDVLEKVGVPGPFPLALGENWLSRLLVGINRALIAISRGLFSYQIFLRIKAQPTLETLLKTANEQSAVRRDSLTARSS